jgi:hypothetical protein
MRLAALALFVVIIAQLAFAAASAQEAAAGPEIQRLGYYVGTWRGEGETRGGPFGPAGRLSSTMSCEWFAGGFQLVCRGQENGPTGTRQFLNLRSYDPSAHTYTEYSISSMGETEYNTGGTIVGNTRTFLTHVDMGGKPVQIRYIEEQMSPTRYTYRAEASVDGGAWEVIAEGAVTKVQ